MEEVAAVTLSVLISVSVALVVARGSVDDAEDGHKITGCRHFIHTLKKIDWDRHWFDTNYEDFALFSWELLVGIMNLKFWLLSIDSKDKSSKTIDFIDSYWIISTYCYISATWIVIKVWQILIKYII